MPTTRRQFIKRSVGAVSVSLVMPRIWLSEARAQDLAAFDSRKFVVIQFGGGNDGLNTVIPYANARYSSLRPVLSFKEADLKDAQGNSTIISNDLGLHPMLGEFKSLFDAGKVAIVNGVGYPNQSLSHFLGTDIWMTANTNGGSGNGWLGKYADQVYVGKSSLSAVNIGGTLPKAFFSDKFVVPTISNFATYTFQTDSRFAGDRNNQVNTFRANNSRALPAGSFADALADTGIEAVDGAAALTAAIAKYNSSVTYPANNSLANALKMVAQTMTTIPDNNLGYVSLGGFDDHSAQIGSAQEPTNKLIGTHATLLRNFSQAVKAFLDDMDAHGIRDLVIMVFSEFGRRPNENASRGSDHGRAAPMFVMGNPVHGGLYGQYPSLDVTALDSAGNLKENVDFRSVYATILDKWLGADSRSILGASYDNLGFLN
ncbi:MAG: DUF1501 domain-containing protein [Acidobacteriota bacterium]